MYPELFQLAPYTPVDADGIFANHVCAFIRGNEGARVLTVAPRLTAGLIADTGAWPTGDAAWGETALILPPAPTDRPWRDVFTGRLINADGENRGRLPLRAVFADFPVAVLAHCEVGSI